MAQVQSSQSLMGYILPFLEYCEVQKGLSDNTQRNYRQYLRLFETWLKRSGAAALRPHELTADHVWQYRLYLARTYRTPSGGHLSRKSQTYYLVALRALLHFLTERDIATLPAAKVPLAKRSGEATVSFLEVSEVEALLSVPDTSTPAGLRDRAILELLFSTGMRVSELVALDADQLAVVRDKDPNRTFELAIVGKGQRVRTVFISPRAAEALRAYLKSRRDVGDPLFVNLHSRSDEKRLSARAIQLMIARCARLAGLAKHVTPHTLRHSYATDLLAHGADLRSVQELLGHKNVATTQVYTHVTNKRLRDVHETFHAGGTETDGPRPRQP